MMKKVLLVIALTGLIIGASAQADIVFSGQTWQTVDSVHRDFPDIHTEYTVLGPDSGKMRGVYGGGDTDCAMYTALTLNAGDIVSFDWYLSDVDGNIEGGGGGTWYGDTTFQFKTVVNADSWDGIATARFESNSGSAHHWYSNGETWYDNGNYDLNTGLHVEYIMGATDYTLNISSLADPLVSSTTTLAYLDGATVGDIQCFRAGIWDSEQDVTISNFTITPVPEPATLLLLGLGGLVLGRKRR